MTKPIFKPTFLSVFSAYTDEHNYLINQDELRCQEITGQALVVARTTDNNPNWFKQQLQIDLPKPLQLNVIDDEILCLWISPDEYWLLLPEDNKNDLFDKKTDDIRLIDSSGAYGLLALSGANCNRLLARLMSYDIESKLPSGKVVSTMLLQSQVVVFKKLQTDDVLFMLVRHSFANYVTNVLTDTVKRL